MTAAEVKEALKKVSSTKRAKTNAWFFKTGKGEYGEGDKFIGVTVPNMRKVAKEFKELSLTEIRKLLGSKIHEHRYAGLLILGHNFGKHDAKEQKKRVDFYLKNTKHVDNWDLVDTSAPYILGRYLLDKEDRKILYGLARSKNMWENRIAMVATWMLIRDEQLKDVYALAEILHTHEHDLMHKAVGWMLREAGKKDMKRLKRFLKKHYDALPRTLLRYAIEKFPERERKKALQGVFV